MVYRLKNFHSQSYSHCAAAVLSGVIIHASALHYPFCDIHQSRVASTSYSAFTVGGNCLEVVHLVHQMALQMSFPPDLEIHSSEAHP
jgi:hypothetical protein